MHMSSAGVQLSPIRSDDLLFRACLELSPDLSYGCYGAMC